MLDSIYHMKDPKTTLKSRFGLKTLRFCLIDATLLRPSLHNVTNVDYTCGLKILTYEVISLVDTTS